jgi:hypothetical protein
VILGVLTGKAHPGTIVLANGLATVGKAKRNGHHPPMFLVGLCGLGMGIFSHCVKRTDSKIAHAKGQAHQSHWGFFFCAIPLPDTIR